MANAISKNQYDYLNGLVSKGGGNGEWAKAQLANSVYTPTTPTPTPSVPKNTAVPTPPTTSQATTSGKIPTSASIPAPPATTSAPAATTTMNTGAQQYAEFQKQQADLMNQLKSYMTPMNYDSNTDPNYQAYKQSVLAGAKDASLASMEDLNSRGILNSSVTRDDVADIEQKYAQQAAAAIPQFQQQAYQQQRARVADAFSMLQNVQDQQQRSIDNANTDRTYKLNYGRETGYITPDASTIDAVQKQMAANSAAYATASPEEQRRLHEENVRLAATIGGTDSTGSGDYVYSPIRTLQGQQLDINQANTDRAFKLNDVQTMAQLTGYLPDGTPTNAKQQQDLQNLWVVAQQTGTIPDQLADLYGIARGTKTQDAVQQAAQLAIARQNANTSAYSATASANNAAARLDWEKSADNPDNMYKMAEMNKINSDSPSSKIDPKDSADNYNLVYNDITSDDLEAAAKKQNITPKKLAENLAKMNRDYLTDSDYKKLLDEINKRF